MVFVIIIDHDHDHNHALLMITKMVIMKIFWCSFTAGYGYDYGIWLWLWLAIYWSQTLTSAMLCCKCNCRPSSSIILFSKRNNDNFCTSGSLTVQGMACHNGATGGKKITLIWFQAILIAWTLPNVKREGELHWLYLKFNFNFKFWKNFKTYFQELTEAFTIHCNSRISTLIMSLIFIIRLYRVDIYKRLIFIYNAVA